MLVNVTGTPPGRTEGDQARAAGPAPAPDWANLVDALEPQPGDHQLGKSTWGAFHNTSLDAHLRDLGVTQIILTGVATSIGVESTARSGYEHGYHIVLATDAVTDIDLDAHHNAVERIVPRLGERATTAEILDLIDHRP